jgi:hypothetical protein
MTMISQGKDEAVHPRLGSTQFMLALIFVIPFMLIAIVVATAPLCWAMKHQEEWDGPESSAVDPPRTVEDRVAA